MIRGFLQHKIRKVQELEGIWEFCRDDGRCFQLPVPGCIEQHPEMIRWRGTGVYRKTIELEHETNLRLEFKGVSHTADVYVDNQKIAHHYNAFTPFSGIAVKTPAGRHEIRVEVDNRFSEASALHVPNDYYTYGGITRPVAMEELPDCWVKLVHVTTSREGGVWTAAIEVLAENLGDEAKDVRLGGILRDATGNQRFEIPEKKCRLEAGTELAVLWKETFSDVSEWNPETPNLYYLELQLKQEDGTAVDDLIERFGFRTVELKGQKLCVNGKPVFLKGFNRHEDYGVIGCAIPPALMVQDLDLMKDMGANAVRTCHYPNDERFLDLCDERGMLVWEENHARGFNLEKMMNPNFDRQCEDCIREMIENHYNHPAIMIWGILNECASETPEGREKYARQYAQIRSLDHTRPVTSATCRHFKDICLDLPDVVSFNMYSGWYSDVDVKEQNDKLMDWIASAGGAGKPVIVSEFGAAAIYGYRDRGHSKWSEERQADILDENMKIYLNDERITGVFIWQFADCRVTEEGGWFASRARSHNNKGVVDEYRRPKEAYDTVRKWYTSK